MNLETIAHLTAIYSGKDRHYHDINHINRMLTDWYNLKKSMVDEYGLPLPSQDLIISETDESMVVQAIWFHDAVYLPGTTFGLSELHSAELVPVCIPEYMYTEITEAICATAEHHINQSEECDELPFTTKVLLDLDILGLADPYDKYMESSEKIRKEFARFSDKEFYEGREKWLTAMLERPNIFYFKFLEEQFGAAAKRNMQEELCNIKFHLFDMVQRVCF